MNDLHQVTSHELNVSVRWHELDLIMEPRRSKAGTCPRAVLYSGRDCGGGHSVAVASTVGPAGKGEKSGSTALHMYTEQQDTSTYLTEWRNWPTHELSAPIMATLEGT